jgi:hypothetical protein
MTTRVLEFAVLPERVRKRVEKLAATRGRRKKMDVRVRREGTEAVPLPPAAAAIVSDLLRHLGRGEKVAILAADTELSPTDAATILGMSRPLVVHRMDVGDLPFRYVGKHRRARLSDVLALKARIDKQQAALDALAEDTEALIRDHGL